MDNTCNICGNDLLYGRSGNLAIHCGICAWHEGYGDYPNIDLTNSIKYNDGVISAEEWLKLEYES